ncbi:MAG: glycosyltransferase family 4 protein [Thermomicrobiaceae bacterium]
MKVGLVIYGDLRTVSGGHLYGRQLVDHLERQGDVVEIFSQEPRSYARNLLRENVSTTLIDDVLESELDVLLQDELNHASLLRANRYFRKWEGIPVVSIVHHLRSSEDRPRWQNAVARQLERRYLRSVDGFIFNGETTKRTVESLAGVTEPSVVAVPAGNRFPEGISEDEISKRVRRDGPLHVIFLGSVIPRKGLHILIDALSRLPSESWRLSVVGPLDADEAYTSAIHRQVRRAGLYENVTLFGTLPDREIARLLKSADLMAMPSSYEGYGIAYLEGMAFGLPALATTSGAASEIITTGDNGWLIDPGDTEAMAAILVSALQDPETLAEMSLTARRRFLAHPTWEDSMSLVRSFLTSLTGSR